MNEKIHHENQISQRVVEAVASIGATSLADEVAVMAHCLPYATGLGKRGRSRVYDAVRAVSKLDLAGQGSLAPAQDNGRLVRSRRGTWARQIGTRCYALTRSECVARDIQPGPGND